MYLEYGAVPLRLPQIPIAKNKVEPVDVVLAHVDAVNVLTARYCAVIRKSVE